MGRCVLVQQPDRPTSLIHPIANVLVTPRAILRWRRIAIAPSDAALAGGHNAHRPDRLRRLPAKIPDWRSPNAGLAAEFGFFDHSLTTIPGGEPAMKLPPETHAIGVISDTHGLLRPQAVAALSGCGLIIHAGDIGKASVLTGLREIAPVAAVRGTFVSRGGGTRTAVI